MTNIIVMDNYDTEMFLDMVDEITNEYPDTLEIIEYFENRVIEQ